MGACSSVNRRVTYIYKDNKKSLKLIPNSQADLRKSIRSEIQIKNFDIFIDNQKIDSDESYKKFINSRTHLNVEIRDKESTKPQTPKEPEEAVTKNEKTFKDGGSRVTFKEKSELVPDISRKQHKVKQNCIDHAPKNLKKYGCTVFSEDFSVEIDTFIVGPGFVWISDESVANPWITMRYHLGEKSESRSLRYVNTFEHLLLYKLQDFNGRVASEKSYFGEENEFFSVIEGNQYSFIRDTQNPNQFSANSPLEDLKSGKVMYSKDQVIGMVSKVISPTIFEIFFFSSSFKTIENLIFKNNETEILETIRHTGELSQFSGKIYTSDGQFIMAWLVVHPEYILIPSHKLLGISDSLVIKLNEKETVPLNKLKRSEFRNIEYLGYFEIFQFNKPRAKTIPETFISQPKSKGVIFNRGKEISMKLINKHSEFEEIYNYQVNQPIDCEFQGTFVSIHGKFFGLIAAINGYSVLTLDLSHFERTIFNKKAVKAGKKGKNYPVIPANSISFKNSPPKLPVYSSLLSSSHSKSSSSDKEDNSSEMIVKKAEKNWQEAGVEEENFEFGGEFQLDLNISEAKPENYTYIATGKNLIKYNSEQFGPIVMEMPIKLKKGASFTTTPYGLIIVSESWAQVIKEETENLPLLMSSHLFHACVWHKGLLFVVSGESNNCVETLEIGADKWQMIEDLPESRKNAAICSAGEYVYLMGGEVNGKVDNSILRFRGNWETISFTLPFPLMKMGLIFSDRKFVVFGGSMEKIFNDIFYVLDENCKLSAKGEFPIAGDFNDKPIGLMNETYSILISLNEVLEFSSGFFKLVKMG